jgi:hypothetical protein
MVSGASPVHVCLSKFMHDSIVRTTYLVGIVYIEYIFHFFLCCRQQAVYKNNSM